MRLGAAINLNKIDYPIVVEFFSIVMGNSPEEY